jgi:hypothetical protein
LLKLAENRSPTREEEISSLGLFSLAHSSEMQFFIVPQTASVLLINQWLMQHSAIEERLEAMRKDISEPYSQAKLPQVLHPEQIE